MPRNAAAVKWATPALTETRPSQDIAFRNLVYSCFDKKKKECDGQKLTREGYLVLLSRYGGEKEALEHLRSVAERFETWKKLHPRRRREYQEYALSLGFEDCVEHSLRDIVFVPLTDQIFDQDDPIHVLAGREVSAPEFNRLLRAYRQPGHRNEAAGDKSPTWSPSADYVDTVRRLLVHHGWVSGAAAQDLEEQPPLDMSARRRDARGTFLPATPRATTPLPSRPAPPASAGTSIASAPAVRSMINSAIVAADSWSDFKTLEPFDVLRRLVDNDADQFIANMDEVERSVLENKQAARTALTEDSPRPRLASARDYIDVFNQSPARRDPTSPSPAKRLFEGHGHASIPDRLWEFTSATANKRCLDFVDDADGHHVAVVLDQWAFFSAERLVTGIHNGIKRMLDIAPKNPVSQAPLPALFQAAGMHIADVNPALVVMQSRDNTKLEDLSPGSPASLILADGITFNARLGDVLLCRFGCLVNDVVINPPSGWQDALDASSALRQQHFTLPQAKTILEIDDEVVVHAM